MDKGFVLLVLVTTFFLSGTVAEAAMKPRESTTLIVVHHSATNGGNAEAIRRYHKEVNKWDDIGYHFVILRDGKVEAGRPENLVGAHARTGRSFNRNPFSVGICLIGNGQFTNEQKKALAQLLAKLCKKYEIDSLSKEEKRGIQGHHEECPGPNLNLEEIKKKVAEQLRSQTLEPAAP